MGGRMGPTYGAPVTEEELALFTKQRDAVLLDHDVAALRRFCTDRGLFYPNTDALKALTTIHRTITSSKNVTKMDRRYSKRWLNEQGFSSLDDGDL